MIEFRGNANEFFLDMLQSVTVGAKTCPRGRDIREQLHVWTEIPNPRQRVLSIFGRRSNPFFQAAETVWILAGASDSEWILHFNQQLEKFLDPGLPNHFHAPYGERLRHWGNSQKFGRNLWGRQHDGVDQLALVVDELRRDPDSRRAVILFGNPLFDQFPTNDRPCNIAFTFKLREGRLHMTTFNRSNDLMLGLTFTNLVQFTTIHEAVAAMLGVELGPYFHYSDSLHLYEDDPILPSVLHYSKALDLYKYVQPTPMQGDPLQAVDHLYLPYNLRQHQPFWSPISCPYWGSIGMMIQAWDLLKSRKADSHIHALDLLCNLPAQDWQMASFEFMVRWAAKNLSEEESDKIQHAIALVLGDLGIHQAVWTWIFHSTEQPAPLQ